MDPEAVRADQDAPNQLIERVEQLDVDIAAQRGRDMALRTDQMGPQPDPLSGQISEFICLDVKLFLRIHQQLASHADDDGVPRRRGLLPAG